MTREDKDALIVRLLSTEGLETSEIEGERLDRASVQASLLQRLGLHPSSRPVPPREEGVAHLMAEIYRNPLERVTRSRLLDWHKALMQGRPEAHPGCFRTGEEAMQIVSGPHGRRKVHFEAPPSDRVPAEIEGLLAAMDAPPPQALAHAARVHLWFESIHPFEDGNGRIGRALTEVALAQALGVATFVGISSEIRRQRTRYYAELERASKGLEIGRWVRWHGEMVLAAQARSLALSEFTLARGRLLERIGAQINARQRAALARVSRDGPDGFVGGLSADNYMKITGASPATARRDLGQLVELGALRRTGEKRGTRYWLNLPHG
jgi:Fic family protein